MGFRGRRGALLVPGEAMWGWANGEKNLDQMSE